MNRHLFCTTIRRGFPAVFLIATFLIATASISWGVDPNLQRGKEIFQKQWTYEAPPKIEQGEQTDIEFSQRLRQLPGDGLGPMFNAASCEACHAAGGASGVEHNVTLITLDPRSPLLQAKTSTPEQLKSARESIVELYPGLLSPRGVLSMDVVVHEASTRHFFDMVRDQIGDFVPGGISDEWYRSESRKSDAIADRPVIAGRKANIDFYLSQRNSPPLFGMGMIDRISQATLLKIARTQTRRSSGKISGRMGLGKFGWRGQTISLDAFVRGACAGEVGLQLAATPQPADVADETYVSLGTDLNESQVLQLVSYVRSLPHPMQETKIAEEATSVREGKRLFGKIGCADCHVENLYPARGIYSDLLLHDMGSLLQAPSPAPATTAIRPMRIPLFPPETPPSGLGLSIGSYYGIQSSAVPTPYAFDRPAEPTFPYGKLPASELNISPGNPLVTWDVLQREWRTPPLWGVADSAPYLHDGRAETLDSSIRWHDGEAHDSVTKYRSLQSESREQILAFLSSLRSPPTPHRAEAERIVKARKKARSAPVLISSQDPAIDNDSIAEALEVFRQGL